MVRFFDDRPITVDSAAALEAVAARADVGAAAADGALTLLLEDATGDTTALRLADGDHFLFT